MNIFQRVLIVLVSVASLLGLSAGVAQARYDTGWDCPGCRHSVR